MSIWLVSSVQMCNVCRPNVLNMQSLLSLETCIEINKYKIYAKFIPFPNNNNLVTYHKILKIGEPDAEHDV